MPLNSTKNKSRLNNFGDKPPFTPSFLVDHRSTSLRVAQPHIHIPSFTNRWKLFNSLQQPVDPTFQQMKKACEYEDAMDHKQAEVQNT